MNKVKDGSICKQCHKEFVFNLAGPRLFCSKECHYSFKRENSNDYRVKALALLPNECFYCLKKEKLNVHHLDHDFLNNDIENLRILCSKCHRKQHGNNALLRQNKFKEGNILAGLRMILDGLRVDLRSEQFEGTPERVLRSYYEMFEGIGAEEEIKELFSAVFPSDYSGIIINEPVKCFSMCPHHLLPIEYDITIGYISEPKQQRMMLGISKLARVVQLLSRRLVLQETVTEDIASVFMKHLNANGVMVVVRGKHMCMRMRGINKPGTVTITSSVKGVFEKDSTARMEFLELIKNNNKQ